MITFQQLMEGYQRACVGPHACDRIEAAEPIFTEILDKILQPRVFDREKVPDGYAEIPEEYSSVERPEADKVLALTHKQWQQRWLVLQGKQPLLLMGANVVKAEILDNEVRFLNSKRPERNHTITI